MKIWPTKIIAIILLALAGDCLSSQTIVPKNDQITDFETLLNLAKILSHHKETQEEALQLYEVLLENKALPPQLIDHLKIKPDFNAPKNDSEKKSKTIVPQNNWITNFDTIWALARIYSHKEKTQERALKLYARLLQEKPENIEIIIEMGRLYITLKRFNEGLDLFYYALERHPYNLKLLVATAQGEVASGHAQEARNLFLAALNLSERKDAILINYADGMMMWGDFYKAEEIYRDALEKNPSKSELLLKLTWSLEAQNRYEEAEGIYRKLLLEYPNDPKFLEFLTRLKIQEKDFDTAQEFVEHLLQLDSENPKYLQLKAEILFYKRLYCDSIETYNEFKNDHEYGVHSYVGMGRAYQRMGLEDDAQTAFQAAYDIDPKDIEARYYFAEENANENDFVESIISPKTNPQDLIELANVSMQNGKPEIALTLYNKALELDPKYFPAQIGKAETLSILYFYNCALEIYQNLLQTFPENSKLMIAIARVLSWAKQYDSAIGYYNNIIDLNPQNPVPYREKARTALWAKEFDLSMETYNQILQRPADDLGEYLIQKSVFLEKRTKVLNWNKRYIKSLDAYRELLAMNPGNEEALFDYAQIYCGFGLCDCSRNIYEYILNIDPNHTLVQKALNRNEIRNNIGLQSNLSYWREIGSGTFSASQIARYRFNQVVEIPLTCRSHVRFVQQAYVENPFFNFKFYPAEGQTIEADNIFNEHLSAFFSATYKTYFHKFRSTITSHNNLLWTVNDYLQVFLSCNKEDEIYNFFSLKQAIQSNVSLVTLSSKLTRYWNISGTFQYYRYNDHNSQVHYNLLTEYQLTEEPNVFKVILQGDYRNAAHQSISKVIGTQLVDMIHPYWTPDKYFAGALTLEWHHDYRLFEFCEAPQRYIDIKITGLLDNANNPSAAAILEWKHEFDYHWGLEIKGFIQRGPLWKAEGAWGTVCYRF